MKINSQPTRCGWDTTISSLIVMTKISEKNYKRGRRRRRIVHQNKIDRYPPWSSVTRVAISCELDGRVPAKTGLNAKLRNSYLAVCNRIFGITCIASRGSAMINLTAHRLDSPFPRLLGLREIILTLFLRKYYKGYTTFLVFEEKFWRTNNLRVPHPPQRCTLQTILAASSWW